MDKITGFESQAAPREMPSVDDVVKALTVNLELAESLFCRRARGMVDRALAALSPKLSEVIDQACPAWVVQSSATINLLMSGKVRDSLVDRAVERVSDAILQEVEALGLRPVLLGAMSTRVHRLGGDTFNFVLKQRFTVGAESEDGVARSLFGDTDG